MQTLSALFSRQDKVRAARRATDARVEIAEAGGVCATLEGEVAYRAGDALVTGVAGERYPVPRQQFLGLFRPGPDTRHGDSGNYTRRPTRVDAVRLRESVQVPLGAGHSMVTAEAGEWLVRHPRDGGYSVLREDIFAKTYVVQPPLDAWYPFKKLSCLLYEAYVWGIRRLGMRPRWAVAAWTFVGVRHSHFMDRLGQRAPAADPALEEGSAQDDETARLLGNAYRGAGVLVGLVAIVVVALSVAAEIFPDLELAGRLAGPTACAVILVLAIVFALGRVKENWIAARLRAERYRFRRLSQLLDPTKPTDEHQLDMEVRFFLGTTEVGSGSQRDTGDNQIVYHRKRQADFEDILRAARRVNRLGLSIAVVAAAASQVRPSAMLIAVAIFAAGIAGALQGINNFLRLQERASEHAEMAARLQALKDAFHRAADAAAKRQVAVAIHEALFTDNADWRKTTRLAHDIA